MKQSSPKYLARIVRFVILLGICFGIAFFFLSQKTSTPLSHEEILRIKNNILGIAERSPADALVVLNKTLIANPRVYSICHSITHSIGHTAYDSIGPVEAMQIPNSAICGGGFIHGVIEEGFTESEEKTINPKTFVDRLCGKNPDATCLHGIGHGFMILYENNVEKADEACAFFSKTHEDCYDGVFMHVLDNEETGISKNTKTLSEGIDLCASVSVVGKRHCYFYLPRTTKDNLALMRPICLGLKKDDRLPCALGVGHTAMKYSPVFSLEKTKTFCEGLFSETEPRESCIKGARMYFVFHNKSMSTELR